MNFGFENETLIQLAMKSDAAVLITGPTGSGKSTLAKKIHLGSSRFAQPFVSVNLASLHEGTFESELFGHEKGAFTGAISKRIGRLETANGGTVFLDEIGELSMRSQGRLLEFLNSKKIVPIGGNREKELNVRIITATNQNLSEKILEKAFRDDLLFRIKVIGIKLKSILERIDELDHFVHEGLGKKMARTDKKILKISESVADLLEKYSWPGNFRELENILEFAVHSCGGDTILTSDLPQWFLGFDALSPHGISYQINWHRELSYRKAKEFFEENYYKDLIKITSGALHEAEAKAGVSRSTIIRKLRKIFPNEKFKYRNRQI